MATNHGVGGSNPSSPTTGPKGKDLSLRGGRKIMLGIADSKLWNLVGDGSFVEIEWSGLLFYLNLDIYIYYIYRLFFLHIVFLTAESAYFSKPRNSSSARLGQNSRASTSISSIEKMRSSSLSH